MLKSQRRIGYLLIAPALTVVVLLSIYPILYQFWLSLTDWYILRNPEPVFQGLKGYQRFFQDPMVWSSLGRTAIWTIGTVLIEFAVGLPLALLLNRRTRLNAVLSGLILLPWVTPSIVVAYAWRWLLDGQYGTVHYLLHTVGLVGERSLLGNPSIALYVVTVISAWKGIPFMAVETQSFPDITFTSGMRTMRQIRQTVDSGESIRNCIRETPTPISHVNHIRWRALTTG